MLTGETAIAVRIIAAKQGTGSIPVDDLLIISNGLAGRCVPKILAIMLGGVAVAENVLFRVVGQLDGICQCLPELHGFGGIA